MRTDHYTIPAICPATPKASDIHRPWYVFFRFHNAITGKWVMFKLKKGINSYHNYKERLKEAHALRDALIDALEEGWNPITKKIENREPDPLDEINELSEMPFKKAVLHALSSCQVAPRTLKNYTNSVKRILQQSRRVRVGEQDKIYDFTRIPVNQIRKKHIKLLLDHCKKEFNWSNKAFNKHMGYFKSVLSRLVHDEIISVNPALGIKYLPVTETRKFIPYTEEEKTRIREHLYLHHYGFFVVLMIIYNTGMRPNEVLALRPSDVDLEKRLIKIIPDQERDNSKTKNIRHVPISESLFVLLKQWLKHEHKLNYYLFGSPYESRKGLRGSTTGGFRGVMHPDFFKPSPTRIKRDTLTKLWKKVIIDGLGISKHFYSAKHSGADAKILAGISIDALQSMYGHTSKYMTLKYITELKEIHAREIREKSPEF